MSKVFACLCAIMLIVSVGATAQETVNFTAAPSQSDPGLVTYNATLVGGYDLGTIDWDGIVTEIISGTYATELKCLVTGPTGSVLLTLGTGTTYVGPINFTGSDNSLDGTGDPAGAWTFDFYESYSDAGDGTPDAVWDTIDITFGVTSGLTCLDEIVDLGAMACADTLAYSGDTTGAYDYCEDANGDNHFSFEVLEAGIYTISLCATAWDTRLYLYDDTCCGNLVEFDDDDCDGPGSGLASVITIALDPGVFYVLVGGYGANEGLYDLEITCEGFPTCTGPDTCADALLITQGSYAGDTGGCTDAFTTYDLWGWPLEGNDHVYAIDVPCGDSEICVTLTPLDGQDPAVALAMDCTDGSVVALAGADNGLAGDAEAFCYINTGDEVGTLYIYVDSYGAGSGGNYTLDVTVTAVANDTCDTAIDASAGGVFTGTNCCANNDYDVDNTCIAYATSGPEVVYSVTVGDATTLDVALIPTTTWDPALYIISDCGDPVGSCLGGADNGLGGDPEYATIDLPCAGTYYIMADSWYATGASSCGDFDLDVTITTAPPVDTFDVSMLCDPDPLVLPTNTKIRVYVTNTTAAYRQFCGTVGVTLCNGVHINNLRAGNMVLAGGLTKFIGWGQRLPVYPATCDCTLVFDVTATDCTPCEEAAGVPAGWEETASCGITTVCP